MVAPNWEGVDMRLFLKRGFGPVYPVSNTACVPCRDISAPPITRIATMASIAQAALICRYNMAMPPFTCKVVPVI